MDGQMDGWMDRLMDGQTDRPKPICPLDSFEVGVSPK